MKKIPTLFVREFDSSHTLIKVTRKVTPGCEWVLDGEGEATEKVDGSACAIINGRFYKRFDAKPGRRVPPNAIPCQEADPITKHWPHWVPVTGRYGETWLLEAYKHSPWNREDGTYEAVGPHFQGNPYGLDEDFLERHGRIKLPDCPRDFAGIRDYLRTHEIEGIVFWKDGLPGCKIKRTDFGLDWPIVEDSGNGN